MAGLETGGVEVSVCMSVCVRACVRACVLGGGVREDLMFPVGRNKYLMRLNLKGVESLEEAGHPSPLPPVLDSARVFLEVV